MDVYEFETQTGCRLAWNTLPPSRTEAVKLEVPVGLLFTPLKDVKTLQLVEYEPVRAKQSQAILNPYCAVDFRGKAWSCPFTYTRTPFLPHYAEHITEQTLPAELMYPVLEYVCPQTATKTNPNFPSNALTFVFVVDTCLYEEELKDLNDSLQQGLSLLSPETRIALITFGTLVYLHELDSQQVNKVHVFRGNKQHTAESVQKQLLFQRPGWRAEDGQPNNIHKFIKPIGDCEYTIMNILDELKVDPWPVEPESRPKRCVGAALSVALGLLENSGLGPYGSRITLLNGGICTFGPGKIVDLNLSEPIRQHIDIAKDRASARYSKKAVQYYSELANRAVSQGFAIDIFACSLDQTGIHEMRVLLTKTGGLMVMADSFSMNVFKESFKKMFETDASGYLRQAYDVQIDLICSKNISICGAVGPIVSAANSAPYVSDLRVGEGETCSWKCGSLDKGTTLAFYFEMSNAPVPAVPVKNPHNSYVYLQFQTHYMHSSGRRRTRVTTLALRVGENPVEDCTQGFDQEAAAVLIARLAVLKSAEDDILDVLRWLDRKLIRLVSKVADYQKGDASTFHLTNEFAIYPQFMYHLRRSHFLQTFNASPDETAYYRTILMRLNTMNSIVGVQPALLEYSFDSGGTPEPVLLDVASLKSGVILLLDSFFHLVVWHGEKIQHWRNLGYQNSPEYKNFAQLLQAPVEDARAILEERFPVPKYVQCSAGGSQARFLLARVNPSATHNCLGGGGPAGLDGSVIHTDDVSLKVFMEHLIKLAVQS